MRITGGTLRGRRFDGPKGTATRPTADKVREAIASALASRGLIDGAAVLDLFTGTGALGFEALSRGAARALLVDRDPKAVQALKTSAQSLGLEATVTARKLDLGGRPASVAAQLSKGGPFDLVFADPPYDHVQWVPPLLVALAQAGGLSDDAVAVIEHATRHPPTLPSEFAILADYRYGDTAVALVRILVPRENPA